MKSGQPLRPEDKRDIDIAMETKRRAGGFGLGAGDFLGSCGSVFSCFSF